MAKVNKEVTETPKKRGRPAKKPELKDNEANSKAEELLTVTGAEAEAEVKAEEPVKKPVKPRVSRVKPPELFPAEKEQEEACASSSTEEKREETENHSQAEEPKESEGSKATGIIELVTDEQAEPDTEISKLSDTAELLQESDTPETPETPEAAELPPEPSVKEVAPSYNTFKKTAPPRPKHSYGFLASQTLADLRIIRM